MIENERYELYDLDGDGMPDVAKLAETDRWFEVTSVILEPWEGPSLIIRDQDAP